MDVFCCKDIKKQPVKNGISFNKMKKLLLLNDPKDNLVKVLDLIKSCSQKYEGQNDLTK